MLPSRMPSIATLLLAIFAMLCFVPAQAAEEGSFDLFEIVVEGNSVLSTAQIEKTVYPFLGENKNIADVEAARTALEKAYQSNGYLTVFVDIPEQKVQNGVVRLRVTEGQVERLRVTGSRYYSLGAIREKTPELAEGSVPYFPEVQKQLAAVNRGGDRRVTPVLRPGLSPGKVEVDLKVDDSLPVHGNVELNNRYSAGTSHTRLNANLRYDNLWQKEHSLSIGIQTAPENTDDTSVLLANYVWPLDSGDYMAVYGLISNSDVAAVGDVKVIGSGKIVGLRFIKPLRAREGFFHTLTLGVDYKNFKDSVTLQGAGSIDTPISYLPFTFGYEATLMHGAQSMTQFTSALNFNLRGLADEEVECVPGFYINEFGCKRWQAEANYAFLRLDVKHTHTLESGWSLFGRLLGQVASGPLISNEQFSAGGVDTVRGYTESIAAGDNGLVAGLELRTPSLSKWTYEQLDELTLFAFAEGASLSVLKPLPGQIDQYDLYSAGLGLRFKGWGGVSGYLDLAYPFETISQVEAGDTRLNFRLGYEW